jgi:hypothetical protein
MAVTKTGMTKVALRLAAPALLALGLAGCISLGGPPP